MNDQQQVTLESFVSSYWPSCDEVVALGLVPMSGDAGFRRYYRTGSGPSAIAVDSPPDKEGNLEYVRMNILLRSLGVHVPRMYAVDFSKGYFLLEDLGSDLLQHRLVDDNADDVYQKALDQLDFIQSLDAKPDYVSDYNQSLLLAELMLFRDWFLQKLLAISLTEARQKSLDRFFDVLIDEALAQPKVLVHRDYHSRNLMCLENGGLAVIDFQDAVWGPITYDLVSLARDCYVRWSPGRIDQCVNDRAQQLLDKGVIVGEQRQQFRRWFDLMGLQRHIKVLGVFARLHLRDGKSAYLDDLPLVLRYTLDVLDQYDEFSELKGWMLDEVVPACALQPWYSDWRLAGAELEIT